MDSKQIIEHLDRLCAESGIKGVSILACGILNREDHFSKFIVSAAGYSHESAMTVEEAFDKMRAKILSPEKLAARKREEAQRLVLEAELLEREGAQAS